MKKSYLREKSFTLIEILLALAILGAGLVGILSLFAVGSGSVHQALNETRAALLAQIVLEEIKYLGASTSANFNTISDTLDIDAYRTGLTEYNNFTLGLDVTDAPLGVQAPNLKKIEVTVSWDAGNKQEKFVTYITKYGP